MDYEMEDSFREGVLVQDAVQLPPDYKVVLLNDDFTTREFVVQVLMQVFRKPEPEAVAIMEAVHRKGRGVAGVYTYDIAASRARETMRLASANGFPLRCELEER